MLDITMRSAYWTLVLFFLGASGLVAADMDSRKPASHTHDVVMSSAYH